MEQGQGEFSDSRDLGIWDRNRDSSSKGYPSMEKGLDDSIVNETDLSHLESYSNIADCF
jgi:predicted Rdx family selenoprotein